MINALHGRDWDASGGLYSYRASNWSVDMQGAAHMQQEQVMLQRHLGTLLLACMQTRSSEVLENGSEHV